MTESEDSEDDPTEPRDRFEGGTETEYPSEASIEDVLEQLEQLEATVDSKEEMEKVHDVRRGVERLPGNGFVRKQIDRYTTRDIAESFVGSIIISLPLLVEDGVYDIADHLLSNTVFGIPVWLVANLGFIALLTWGLLYWADFRDVRITNPLFGIIPRRLFAVLVISLTTATVTMTLWGRVEGWSDPDVAFARISVIWAAAAFGGAIGDILPGPSTGTSLGDVPGELNESISEAKKAIRERS